MLSMFQNQKEYLRAKEELQVFLDAPFPPLQEALRPLDLSNLLDSVSAYEEMLSEEYR